MMCRSASEAGVPFRLASMTRRQASTVAWSPRSFAASRTIQAASEDLSEFGSSAVVPRRSRATAPNGIAFICDVPLPFRIGNLNTSSDGGRLGPGLNTRGILPGRGEFQAASRCLEVEAAKPPFQVVQVLRGDAVILCAQKQQ